MVPSYRTMANNRDATMIKSWNEAAAADRPDHVNIYISNFGPIPHQHHVHHIDNNHENNDPSNLMALPRVFHNNLHSNYSFYFDLASQGRMNKKLLQSVLDYYTRMNYSLRKKFSIVFVEFLLLNYDPSLKSEAPQIIPKGSEHYVELSKKVRSTLAPYYKQNDLFFGVGGIYDRLSKKQVDKCFKKLLKTVSELYAEVKEGPT